MHPTEFNQRLDNIVLSVVNDYCASEEFKRIDALLQDGKICDHSKTGATILRRPHVSHINTILSMCHEAVMVDYNHLKAYVRSHERFSLTPMLNLIWWNLVASVYLDDLTDVEIQALRENGQHAIKQFGYTLEGADEGINNKPPQPIKQKGNNMKASQIMPADFTGSVDVVAGFNVDDLSKDDAVELLGKLQDGIKVLEDSPAADTKYIQDKIVVKKTAIEIVTDILNK